MKTILFTRDDPIYMPRYLEPIFAEKHESIAEVVLAPNQQSLFEEVKQRYAMFGPWAFFRFGLKYGKGKFLDALDSSKLPKSPERCYSVQTLARDYNIPVQKVDNINSESFLNEIHEKDPDLILSIACEQIMDENLLSIPEKGAVNIHGSLLPEYRGMATSFWVLYHNETKSGVTAHYMTPEVDAGDIIKQYQYEIDQEDTMHDLYLKLIETGGQLAIDVLEDIENGNVETTPNNVENGNYYSNPTAEDRKEFLRRGNRFI